MVFYSDNKHSVSKTICISLFVLSVLASFILSYLNLYGKFGFVLISFFLSLVFIITFLYILPIYSVYIDDKVIEISKLIGKRTLYKKIIPIPDVVAVYRNDSRKIDESIYDNTICIFPLQSEKEAVYIDYYSNELRNLIAVPKTEGLYDYLSDILSSGKEI